MLEPVIPKNDTRARILIITASVIVFLAVAVLSRVEVPVGGAFDVHVFARINAALNSVVAVLLVLALIAVKQKKLILHRNVMLVAMILSAIFLVSYICHHLFAGDTKFGGQGSIRYFYYFVLITHIILAATILPFILFTAYRGLTAEFGRHVRLARITWPIWFYVSVTGVIVYWMISPYYG